MPVNASHIMNHSFVSIRSDNTIFEAIKIMAENDISGLPVVDENRKVFGIISEQDIVEYFSKLCVVPCWRNRGLPCYCWKNLLKNSSNLDTLNLDAPFTDMDKERFNLIAKVTVDRAMSKNVVKAIADVSVHEIARLMKVKGVNRIPVVDELGKIIGIIARDDLIAYLAESEIQMTSANS